jgi:glycosyltransferase involved in cell wall biosynthesis
VRVTGEVPDVRPLLAAASAVVAPLRFGSGARQKILEAWAMEKSVVATTVGAEGLGGRDGEHLLIADGPEPLARSVVRVLREAGLRDGLRGQGRRLVIERHDPARVAAGYHRRLVEIVAEKAAPEPPLRVALDLRWMVPGRAGGLESVARSFFESLVAWDSRNRYVALVPARCRFDFDLRSRPTCGSSPPTPCARMCVLPADPPGAPHRAAWLDAHDSPHVARLDFLHELDAEIAYSFRAHRGRPPALRHALLVTDIQHEYHRSSSPRALRERRELFADGLRRADHVCAISEFTRRTLIERLEYPRGRSRSRPWPRPPPSSPARGRRRCAARGPRPERGYLFFPRSHLAAQEPPRRRPRPCACSGTVTACGRCLSARAIRVKRSRRSRRRSRLPG